MMLGEDADGVEVGAVVVTKKLYEEEFRRLLEEREGRRERRERRERVTLTVEKNERGGGEEGGKEGGERRGREGESEEGDVQQGGNADEGLPSSKRPKLSSPPSPSLFPSLTPSLPPSSSSPLPVLPHYSFPVYLLPSSSIAHLAGWSSSRSSLAHGLIPPRPESSLSSLLSSSPLPHRILAVDKVSDTTNLGSLIRSAAAFSSTCVLLSRDSCDAWYRKSVRTSMGQVFRVPVFRVEDLASTLTSLSETHGIPGYAALCGPGCVDVVAAPSSSSYAVVVGNEGEGVRPSVAAACAHLVTVPMVGGVDSLNITVAASIVMHEMASKERRK